jgi:hypothetical protein
MKQKLLVFIVLILLVLLLVGLNAATYTQKEKVPDTEFAPNRSTYNAGSTGTQAFYALLSETGRNVVRWRSSIETLRSDFEGGPSVFVIIGPLRRGMSEAESTNLMEWVAAGGTLVLIDRDPRRDLVTTTTPWQISVTPQQGPDLFLVDAADPKQMTLDTPAQKPVHPSYFSHNVNAVQPSRFASALRIERQTDGYFPKRESAVEPTPDPSNSPYDLYSGDPAPASPIPLLDSAPSGSVDSDEVDGGDSVSFESPIVHVGQGDKNILVDAPFSDGRVVILSDPYIVSNNGISSADNSRLAVNIVTSLPGQIAFDEYHHGFGDNNNRFFQYFEGTPVIAIFLQCGLVVVLILFSQSRRFGRPLPADEPSRLSKLEYVAAMAELQQRTRAYDLAIENIYGDFRRRASALVGVDNVTTSRRELAERIAERTGAAPTEIDDLLFKCEDVIHGEPIRQSDALDLIARLRRLEVRLAMKRANRGA